LDLLNVRRMIPHASVIPTGWTIPVPWIILLEIQFLSFLEFRKIFLLWVHVIKV